MSCQCEAHGIDIGQTRYSGELVRDYCNRRPLNQFGKKRSGPKVIVVGKPEPAHYDRH